LSDGNLLADLDYSVVQQCMHCGICLPTCPTYALTLSERSSPRGRIAMMRAIADGELEVTRTFADEMYFCLGCLACQTACPAGVDYATLFERARAEVERVGVLDRAGRRFVRWLVLRRLFVSRRLLRLLARLLFLYQRSGVERLVRASGLQRLLPRRLHELEPLTPRVQWGSTLGRFHGGLDQRNPASPQHRVGLLAGCVQDVAFVGVNVDTIQVLQANGCHVVVPRRQQCCGSLHAHNGDVATARRLARANLDAFDLEKLDAVIVNAGGCGSHMRQYGHLLADEPRYAARAADWDRKVRDIHEFLVEIGFRAPSAQLAARRVAYHASCHLAHGQKVVVQPQQVLGAIPGVELVPLPEADWCCGSAGVYNITQPETSMRLLDRKMANIGKAGAQVVVSGNPGCTIQLIHGASRHGSGLEVAHPVSLLAAAYRAEEESR